jgi:hypothetical protein
MEMAMVAIAIGIGIGIGRHPPWPMAQITNKK